MPALNDYLALPETQRAAIRATLPQRAQAALDRQIITHANTTTKAPADLTPYLRNPAAFAHTYIPTLNLTPYQTQGLHDLVDPQGHGRTAIKGPRGLGKTTLLAVTIIWFAIVHNAARADWKIVITSGSWFQITAFLFPEIKKIARLVDWETLGTPPWREEQELLKTSINLEYGNATSASPDRAELIEGAHAAAHGDTPGAVLVVFDESKAIPDATWTAIEGVFSNIDNQTTYGYAIAVSTPGAPSGTFYQIHTRAPGTHIWTARSVTLQDAINAGRVEPDWADNLADLWGPDSSHYKTHVLGQFAADDEDAVIPSSWVEAAIERWRARQTSGWEPPPELDYGIDVAREGKDKTIVCIGRGLDHVERFHRIRRTDNFTDTADDIGTLTTTLGHKPTRIAIDSDGMGAGLGDILRAQGHNVYFFRGAPRPERWKDATGELEAFNRRSAAWWNMRELLDPAHDPVLCLPPDDELIGDLTAPRKVHDSQGRIKIEAKEQTKKRIGRSPDVGDACVYRHYHEQKGTTRARWL